MWTLDFFETIIFFAPIASCSNVGFFCNVGHYSHDAYSKFLADAVGSDHNVSLFQIKIFTYNNHGSSFTKFPYFSHDFSHDPVIKEGEKKSQRLMWERIFPYDKDNGSSLDGIYAALQFQNDYMRACESALENRTFLNKIKTSDMDMITIDCAMNEFPIGLANMLDLPAAYVVSGPLDSIYLAYVGVPSNPAYVPVSLCNFEPHEEYFDRAFNFFGYINLMIFRRLFYSRVSKTLYKNFNFKATSLSSLEPATLVVATSWELFLDTPRPLARNVRYFGCERCSAKGQEQSNFTSGMGEVVLVSFGTTISAEDIPVSKLQALVTAFAYFPAYQFIWQLDVSKKYFQENVLGPIKIKMPQNVKLLDWMPMKELLGDPKVVLLITHGGATSCLEAAYSGTPILGIAIHSDQYYNTQRFAYKRLGEALSVTDIDKNTIIESLISIFSNQKMYKERATKFRAMLMDYRKLENSSSKFWIDFWARQFGKRSKNRNSKLYKFWALHHPRDWFLYHSGDIVLIMAFILIFMVYLFET